MRSLYGLAAAAALATGASAQTPQLSEVVVTGAPYPVSLDSVTGNVDIVGRERLDSGPAGGLGEVLSGLPGVRSSFFGPGASRPVIRGLAGPRVLVLTNGIGLIDASGLSPDHQVASDPQEAERIEVLRGPSALAYGGSAIGGVVNVIDGRIPEIYAAGPHGRLLASASSVDDGREASGAVRLGAGGHWMLTADGAHRESGDYRVPVDPASGRPGQVANSGVTLDAYGAGGAYIGEGAWAGLAVKRTQSDYGSPAEADVSIGLKQTRVDARGEAASVPGPFEKVRFAAGWADYRHTEFESGEAGTTFLSQGYEGRLELVQPDRGGWQGAVGLQGLHRDFDAVGEEALIPATRIDEWGAFVLQRLDRDAWGVEGGLRLDRRSLDSVAGRRAFTNFSASAGVFVRPAEGWFLGVSASRTSRAPTEEELFSRGAHPATGAFEIGDPGLDQEVSRSLDGTIHYSAGPWRLDLHGFGVRYDRFIDLVPTGAVDEGSGFPVFAFVSSGAEFYGAEAEASYRLWEGPPGRLTLEGAYDYVHGDTDLGPAVRMPPWSATARLLWEGPRWSATVEGRKVGRQDRVAAFERPTEGYGLLNVQAAFHPNGPNGFRLLLDARNLTDQEAREHASFLKDVAPLPGRNIRIGMARRF